MPVYPSLFDTIVETKDLHSEEGEMVLALIGKVSNIIRSKKETPYALEWDMIQELADGLPDLAPEDRIRELED